MTCHQQKNHIGFGVVVRDYHGQVLGYLRNNRNTYTFAFNVEALCLFEVVNFYEVVGFTNLILEGEALQVIKILRQEAEDYSEGGCIINDARSLLNSFANWFIQYSKKSCNVAAHLLAQNAINCSVPILLLEERVQLASNG